MNYKMSWIIPYIRVINSDAISVRQVTKMRNVGQVWGNREWWGLW